MARHLRSVTRQVSTADPQNLSPTVSAKSAETPQTKPNTAIKAISTSQILLDSLSLEETRLLRKKQHRLRIEKATLARTAASYGEHIATAFRATYIFAQHEAGTGVCVDSRGWILTCAHCFGESEMELREDRYKWLLDHAGRAVQVECCFWDGRRDLALAKIICVETDGLNVGEFIFIPLHSSTSGSVYSRTDIVCIGQPGADDLKSETPQATDYDLIEISEGRLRGLVPHADPHDNSEIGSLKHDAWTYWGHSGAPLICARIGGLLGLHSSWDENTAMRHGVPLFAVRAFLELHVPVLTEPVDGDRDADGRVGMEVIIID